MNTFCSVFEIYPESGEEQELREERDAVAHDDIRDRLHERH